MVLQPKIEKTSEHCSVEDWVHSYPCKIQRQSNAFLIYTKMSNKKDKDFSENLIKMFEKTKTNNEILNLFIGFMSVESKAKEIRSMKEVSDQEKTYFILDTNTNMCKIGTSKDVDRRLKTLSCANSSELKLLLTVSESEKSMHERFCKYRVKGEWFKIEGELQKFLFDN